MSLLNHKSNKEMAYDMLTLLKEMEDMSYHNIGCYANKEEYKKQYATELYKIELLSQIKLDISKKYNVNMALYNYQLKLTDTEVKTILGKEETESDFDNEIIQGFKENMFCDNTGFCCGSSCKNYYKCQG